MPKKRIIGETSFNCCIIGQGKLTLDCAQQLLDKGHTIHGMISANSDVRTWANKHNIANIDPSEDQEYFLKQWQFDFLFSIINPDKTSNTLLQIPRRGAINFHDAPLPKYAGLHVTSWAIQNQEQRFGVTWHEMTEQFDAGQILKQIEFSIDPDDTTFSLNVKCLEKGSIAFAELIDELAVGKETRRPQELSARSSFLSTKRPDGAAIIDWQLDAQRIEALVRGLSYQPDPNPLGLVKVKINDTFYIVTDVEILDEINDVSPGKVTQITDEGISVATGTKVLKLKSCLTMDGDVINLNDLINQEMLVTGSQLALLTQSTLDEIHTIDDRLGRNEAYWTKQLLKSEPYILAQLNNNSTHTDIHTNTAPTVLSTSLVDTLSTVAAEELVGLSYCDIIVALYCCYLKRISDLDYFDIGFTDSANPAFTNGLDTLFATRLPLNISIDPTQSVKTLCASLAENVSVVRKKGGYIRDLVARTPALNKTVFPVAIEVLDELSQSRNVDSDLLVLSVQKESQQIQWKFSPQLLDTNNVNQFIKHFETFVQHAIAELNAPLASIPLINAEERQQLLIDWNQTQRPYEQDKCIHELIERKATESADDIALVFCDAQISYSELNSRANYLASRLQSLGAKPDVLIGIFIERSIEMVIALLAVLKSGAAYVPLDPAYPRDRVALMINDASVPILITHSKLERELPANEAAVVCIDRELANAQTNIHPNINSNVTSSNLAYVIYTSGSTGKPKGVMVEHRNVINFMTGMDDTLDYQGDPGVWLAVTSISFDISVLEIFWTLSRGFKVVIQEEEARLSSQANVSKVARKFDIGLMFFSSDAGPSKNTNRYRLMLEGSKFADTHGFSTVWTPERHFHLFGGLYPNPSVTSAAIAAVTERVFLRAGSVVLPLHNPIRVAEEWSVVDNLSGGRVGFSFACGWHANDFSLAPDNYADRKNIMNKSLEQIRTLWKGGSITVKNGEGEPFEARIFPPPVQEDPPMWFTTAGNPESFRYAGEQGFNILTNLLGQSIEELTEKITAYREGRERMGHKGDGNVSVMVHTFVGTDVEEVRELVRQPFGDYLKTSIDLVKIAPWAFPAFNQPSKSAAQDKSFDVGAFTAEDVDALVDHAFDRYFETAAILGTPESVLPLVDQLKTAGVDEIACLVDFGVDDQLVLDSLPNLARLLELSNPITKQTSGEFSIAAQIHKHNVTHFQCTPSMARILASDDESLRAMACLQKILLGGEALPADLAKTLKQTLSGDLINVYGPTETTIWSTACTVEDSYNLSIGRPIANTQVYILDSNKQPTPVGVPGELFIGGAGVVRGYLERKELTAEKFIINPFNDSGERIYSTGDLAKYNSNGEIEYLGRLDHQIKLSGYRIELGEIESLINESKNVNDCVVIASETEQGTQGLVAYVVPDLSDKENSDEPVAHWQAIWDETYQEADDAQLDKIQIEEPTFNVSGWLNSFTGQQHPADHMHEWVSATVERILELKPRRVLEIGCGTGLLLYRLAPHCEEYVGVDFSDSALALIEAQLPALDLNNVKLIQSTADTLSLSDHEPFDLVIINSVIQYFPNTDYLTAVLKNVASHLTVDAQIFIGDVRNSILMDTFHTAVELEKAPTTLTLSDLRERIREHLKNETELLIAPDFFFTLKDSIKQIGNVNIQLKRGAFHNEMSTYRYDVVLRLGDSFETIEDPDFDMQATPKTLQNIIETLSAATSNIVLHDIPNPRLEKDISAQLQLASNGEIATVADLRSARQAHQETGIDPEEIYQLNTNFHIELTWSRSGKHNTYDAYFIKSKDKKILALGPIGHTKKMCFEPKQQGADYELTEKLKEHLRTKLPEFMVPREFVTLAAIPLTPNGKINRKALPKPEKRQRIQAEEFVAPESDIEQTIATVLQEMLNLEKIGTKDNFFNLGANSLLILQTNNHLNQRLDKKVSLVSMYRYPTIASLAKYLSGNSDSTQSLEQGQQRGEKRKAAQSARKRRLASRRPSKR